MVSEASFTRKEENNKDLKREINLRVERLAEKKKFPEKPLPGGKDKGDVQTVQREVRAVSEKRAIYSRTP